MAVDSNTPVWPSSLPLPLRSHRQTGEPLSYQTGMESGRIRVRRTVEQGREGLEVDWNFTGDQYEEFKSFFERELENGSVSFLMEVMGLEREVEFRDSSYRFNHSDSVYTVTADLLMAPLEES